MSWSSRVARSSTVLVLALLPGLAPSARAETGRVANVTVFPDRALVTRVIELDASAGDLELTVNGLPARLDRDSLQVRASGPEGLTLGAVELRPVRGVDRLGAEGRELEERIRELEDRRRAVVNRIEALEIQLALIRALGVQPGEGAPPPDTWTRAIETVGERARAALDGKLDAEREIRDFDRELEQLRRQLEDLGAAERDTLDARIGYRSAGAGRARFEIRYTVPGARWRPIHELRLDTESSTMRLTQRAEIRQSTGEDWSGVELHVSASRPELGGRLPELETWYVDLPRPAPEPPQRRAAAEAAPEPVPPPPPPPPPPPAAAVEQAMEEADLMTALLAAGDFSAEYRVPGRVDVPADNSEHRFNLAVHELPVEIGARAVPKARPQAYLYAEATYDGAAELLPGTATLYQDGVLVGSTVLDALPPGGELAAAFGVDERIQIDYQTRQDTRGTEGRIRRQNRRQRGYVIEVTNGHTRRMPITILDQIPVPRDERIDVELTDASESPTDRDVNGRPGVLEWTHQYAPGETRRITFGYRATFPDDVNRLVGW